MLRSLVGSEMCIRDRFPYRALYAASGALSSAYNWVIRSATSAGRNIQSTLRPEKAAAGEGAAAAEVAAAGEGAAPGEEPAASQGAQRQQLRDMGFDHEERAQWALASADSNLALAVRLLNRVGRFGQAADVLQSLEQAGFEDTELNLRTLALADISDREVTFVAAVKVIRVSGAYDDHWQADSMHRVGSA
eukprot:TRINITY_DN11864_c0_g1_i1.p1 TRINITY_DN11864_c0_g1~~TRINITY_DN11864_c0_g1_i1.p1  ORF type:complete len:191 (+),score=43.76 TRINITY_DN11864_c0_g1_i1:120-692(+)